MLFLVLFGHPSSFRGRSGVRSALRLPRASWAFESAPPLASQQMHDEAREAAIRARGEAAPSRATSRSQKSSQKVNADAREEDSTTLAPSGRKATMGSARSSSIRQIDEQAGLLERLSQSGGSGADRLRKSSRQSRREGGENEFAGERRSHRSRGSRSIGADVRGTHLSWEFIGKSAKSW